MSNNVIDAAIRLRDLFTPTVRSVNASLGTMKTQMAAAKQSVSGLSDKLTEHERIQKRTAKSIEQTGGKISGLSDKFALLSAPILAAATAGFKLNSDFTNGLAKVSTLVDTTVVSMDKIKEEIRSVSDETGAGVADLSESVYQAISAGVDAGHAVGFVKDMTIAAKAGFTDATTAVNGVTTVLNAYGKSAEEATAVTDQMLLAQNFGKTSFGEMAQSMGNVIPIAAQLNVSTQELFGSIAVLTKNGIRTSEAITGLKAAYSNILKPSSEAAKLAQSLGLEFNAAHLKSVGWVKFLEEVKTATGGDAEQMALGDMADGLGLLVMNSKIFAAYKKMELVDYDKYVVNDAIKKEITLPTIGGKHVLVTDYYTADTADGKTTYNTFLFGEGAFLSCDKNNYDNQYTTEYDPETSAGVEKFYTKQGKVLHPNGLSLAVDNIAKESPTFDELGASANYALKFNHKNVKMGLIKSLG